MTKRFSERNSKTFQNLRGKFFALTILLNSALLCPAEDSSSTKTNALQLESRSPWQGSVAVGVKLAESNTDSPSFAAALTGTREWGKGTLELGADATLGTGAHAVSDATVNGFIEYNRSIAKRAYLFGRSDAERDMGSHLEYRFINSAGAGGRVNLLDRFQFRYEGGPALVTEKQADDAATYATFRFAERLNFKLTDRIRLWQAAEFEPQLDRFENYLTKIVLGVETDLTQRLSLRVFVQDEYDHEPAPGEKRNDLKLITALAFKF